MLALGVMDHWGRGLAGKNSKPCALCGSDVPLIESHILPAFVFRWLKNTSATGFLRYSETPNRRVQDGLRLPWCCPECEALFSKWETPFASKVFAPLNADEDAEAQYEEWMLKFCVSVSWRVLTYMGEIGGLDEFSDEQQEEAAKAEAQWASFLLGQAEHPGRFEQHLLPLTAIASTSATNLASNINRYFLRGTEFHVANGQRTAVTYAKFGRFALFGILQPSDAKYAGTKIHVRSGSVGGVKTYDLPHFILDYMNDRAARNAEISDSISEAQHEKMERDAMSDIHRFRSSGTFLAMEHDARMFGSEAVIRKPKG